MSQSEPLRDRSEKQTTARERANVDCALCRGGGLRIEWTGKIEFVQRLCVCAGGSSVREQLAIPGAEA